MLDAFREGLENGSIEAQDSGKKQIQAKLLLEMMAIDRERAITATKAWAKFVELASGRQHHVRFATLEEYFPYRILDVGEMLVPLYHVNSQLLIRMKGSGSDS